MSAEDEGRGVQRSVHEVAVLDALRIRGFDNKPRWLLITDVGEMRTGPGIILTAQFLPSWRDNYAPVPVTVTTEYGIVVKIEARHHHSD